MDKAQREEVMERLNFITASIIYEAKYDKSTALSDGQRNLGMRVVGHKLSLIRRQAKFNRNIDAMLRRYLPYATFMKSSP